MKKLSIIPIFLIIALTFSSCYINITIGKPEDEQSSETIFVETTTDEWLDDEDDVTPSETEAVTESSVTATNPVSLPENAKSVSAKKALKMYEKYFGNVKSDGVGFTKKQWEGIDNINAPVDTTGLINGILTTVGKNLITHQQADFEASATVYTPGSAEIKSEFPVFGADYVLSQDVVDSISSAYVVKGDDVITYYIYFADCLNPYVGDGGFGDIMTPFDREVMLESVKQYVPVADVENLKLDCTYSGSYMVFSIDKQDKTPIALEQHHYANIDASAELNLVVIKTTFLNGTCTFEMHNYYSDFVIPET